MGNIIYAVTAVFQVFVFFITMYFLILAFFGLFRRKEKKNYTPVKKFAMIVAAHNEEVVIGKLIESMQKLNYPKELYDIFVIADNCTDKTAEISREYGVNVFERFSEDKRGKGYALEWMFSKLFKMDKKYDSICIFDADNLVHEDFLKEINSKMLEGYKVVQGYIDSKNPNDSWIATAYSIAFWSQNRMFQLARRNVGLSNQLGGTGFAIDTEMLQKLGWGATCLTEDLEFTCKLVSHGEKVGWAHDAKIFDEKPLTLVQSWSQRKRWMQGFTDVASRYFFKLIKESIKQRKFYMFDCALYVMQPFVTLLLGISAVLTLVQSNFGTSDVFVISNAFSDVGWKVFIICQFLITPLVLKLEKKVSTGFFALLVIYSLNIFILPILSAKIDSVYAFWIVSAGYSLTMLLITFICLGKKGLVLFIRFLLYGLYTVTWIPITIQGILNKNNKEWSHTKHVRNVEICDL
ncbi:glycosyl transferase family 2 [Clostridium baratii]|uniref:Glycosyl transferase family protein n=1 Tax=Clostridium baratii TaxID=1561 RepID=A0A174PD76_9CLOT|nr:glycosyltransferase family 2 protein [Clostridium baratii]OPF50453.1 glycosyl transferase family 2 [Clostridium baratii]OPF53149.1 glycosyl transferase family 2 [Clostridium baratii]OPF55165.1 glycosyl transferase family 2 [Clostridium baratii]OPF61115.1 glycosyl transferase family 2 [Clostridium baratii]CUP58962.1 glycosyl transferase family protein [Clostridium baratii]